MHFNIVQLLNYSLRVFITSAKLYINFTFPSRYSSRKISALKFELHINLNSNNWFDESGNDSERFP